MQESARGVGSSGLTNTHLGVLVAPLNSKRSNRKSKNIDHNRQSTCWRDGSSTILGSTTVQMYSTTTAGLARTFYKVGQRSHSWRMICGRPVPAHALDCNILSMLVKSGRPGVSLKVEEHLLKSSMWLHLVVAL